MSQIALASPSNIAKIYVDRSRIVTTDRCRRLRWLEYHEGSKQRGVSPIRKSIHLVLGGAVHAGLEVLLREAQAYVTHRQQMELSVEDAVRCLFEEEHEAGLPYVREVEAEAVHAALAELAAMSQHGVELDSQEKDAVAAAETQQKEQAQAAGATAKAAGDGMIEITFDGWGEQAQPIATSAAAVPIGTPSLNEAPSIITKQEFTFDEAREKFSGAPLQEQLKASITLEETKAADMMVEMVENFLGPKHTELAATTAYILGKDDWAKPSYIDEGHKQAVAANQIMLAAMEANDPQMQMLDQQLVDTARALASQAQATGIDNYLKLELAAQVEGMVRAYARRRLRPLLTQFEVLEVEREGEWKLGEAELEQTEWYCMHCKWVGEYPLLDVNNEHCPDCKVNYAHSRPVRQQIQFMSRHDALLRDRQTSYLYLQSYKTTGAWDRRKEQDAQIDMQGLSEAVDVDNRLGEAWNLITESNAKAAMNGSLPEMEGVDHARLYSLVNVHTAFWLAQLPEPPQVLGVRYEYLIKGARRADKKDAILPGRYVCESPLIRAYRQDGISAEDTRWSPTYEWFDQWGKSKRVDYRSWQKRAVWESMPIVRWIDMLDANLVRPDACDEHGNPEDVLADQFVTPIMVYRNQRDMEDMLQQIQASEEKTAVDVAAVQAVAHDPALKRAELNRRFKQNRSSCVFPGKCSCYEICHGPLNIRENIEDCGLYTIRTVNHKQELEGRPE